MPSALAIEFFHTASLIADDLPCMDDDDLRRNQPSAHKAYGEPVALLSSYALIAAGYGLIGKNRTLMPNADENTLTIALENASYNTGLFGATGGQFFDLVPPDKTEKTIRRIIHMKTTSLFEIAFVFGWLFGGGDQKQLPAVKQAASHFGLLFQIQDDLDDLERDDRDGGLNIALALGVDKAQELFHSEMQAFQEILKRLRLSPGPLHTLAEIMKG
jgi:geranylgeranyl diphosphate synthase, type II